MVFLFFVVGIIIVFIWYQSFLEITEIQHSQDNIEYFLKFLLF